MTMNSGRLIFLDFMRGLIMILLAAESANLYEALSELTTEESLGRIFMDQFTHHKWNGLHFWDLIQPCFMTIAGTSLYLSTQSRLEKGEPLSEIQKHVLIRSLKLFAFGVALHCVYAGKMVWELWNVLTQLSLTLLIAFTIIQERIRVQLLVSFAILLFSECLYHFVSIKGFNQPFAPDRNFGAFMDMVLMRKINEGGHWVAINFIPSAAHTIWGVVLAKFLTGRLRSNQKIRTLFAIALGALIFAYLLDLTDLSPIIKRICTASFIIASGAWVLVIFAVCYWIIDVKKITRWIPFFLIVGMNSIFIYLLFETVGHQWINKTVAIFSNGITGFIGIPVEVQPVFAALGALLGEWYICYWLYNRKIFFKL